MTQSKNHKERRSALLGMPFNTAERRLRKSVIHELASQLHKNVCARCGDRIESPEDLALIHLQDWQDDPANFWDLTNIAFSHVGCEADRDDLRQEKQKMKRVEVKLEDEHGNLLPGVNHQGQIYVAASAGERYCIRVKNTTSRRLLVVTTVDGRNVINGEPGSVDGVGHVLAPFGEFVFKGWRQTDESVAAFVFGEKADSYSSQMGSPENVGVIGIAVFEELKVDPPKITIREKEYVPYPVPYRPWPHWPWEPRWTYGLEITCSGLGQSGLGQSGLGQSGLDVFGTYCSTGGTGTYTASVGSSQPSLDAVVQSLGTGYGDTLASLVTKTSFNRATEHPTEMLEIRYDSLEALQKQGIMSTPPSRKPKAPSAFPKSPSVTPGYAPAPARRMTSR